MTSSARVLVTGGAGYIGSHACKALAAAGYEPIAYDDFSSGNRWGVRWGPLEEGDVTDRARLDEVFARYRPEAVLHFAALTLVGESVAEPLRYYRTNVAGLLSVLEAAHAHGIGAFVFSSTCAVYGMPDRLPITESQSCAPISPYGWTKRMAEQILADHAAAHGLPHMILRYFNAAGADPDGEIGERRPVESHLVPLMLDAVLGRRPGLTVLGDDYPTPDGTAIRDYIHVADLAEAHVRALDHLRGGGASDVVNIGSGAGYSVRDVIDMAERITGRPVPHEVGPRRAGDAPELVADPAHARRILGADLARRSSLEDIIATAWAWHQSKLYAGHWPD